MTTKPALAAGRDGSARDPRRHLRLEPDYWAGALTIAFLCASLVGTATRLTSSYEHGWWLVAYLALVGGGAQLLLAPGGTWAVHRLGAREEQRRWWPLALWNVGTALVPLGVFTNRATPVLVGSAVLLASLALYGNDMRTASKLASPRSSRWTLAYYAVVIGLVASVLTGSVLAGALPVAK